MKNVLVTVTTAFWIVAAPPIFMLRPSYADSPNGLCLTETEFTAVNTMTEAQIRDWLDGLLPRSPTGGFLKGRNPNGSNWTFIDLDGNPTDPAQQIFNTAQLNRINPRVLLTTLRKEKPRVFRDSRPPSNSALSTLAGCGSSPTARQQIQCMGEKLKEWFYDRLSQCTATPGGWNVDVEKETGDTEKKIFEINQDGLLCRATPENKGAAALFQYTPWKGRYYDDCGWGHPDYPGGVGGNGLFCRFWKQHGWEAPPGPLALSPINPTMFCSATASRCIGVNASGGTPGPNGYEWSTTKGLLTITGVNKQNVKITPPNSGGFEGQIAYQLVIRICKNFNGACVTENNCSDAHTNFTCDGVQFGGGTSCNPGSPPISFVESLPCACGQLPACFPLPDCGAVVNDAFVNANGFVFDRRTDAMRAADSTCKPCVLEMQGVTVTVTDAAGAAATTSVTAK